MLQHRACLPRGGSCFYTMPALDELFATLYHALVHKGVVKEGYRQRVAELAQLVGVELPQERMVSDQFLASVLNDFMDLRGYEYSQPHDKTVGFYVAFGPDTQPLTLMECSSCFQVFHNKNELPFLFATCGHSICLICCEKNTESTNDRLLCPKCGVMSFSVLRNWAMLECWEKENDDALTRAGILIFCLILS